VGSEDVGQRDYENSPDYLREVLKSVVDIGSSLRLQMDTETLFRRVVANTSRALRFRYVVLYLDDGEGFFRASAADGISDEEEIYLQKHPIPDNIVARIVDEQYRISDSYFLPAEAEIWRDQEFAGYFVADDSATSTFVPVSRSTFQRRSGQQWRPEDLLVVPLVSGDNQLLGFLTPDSPLNGLRPTIETMTVLELFANQAAVAIEGARLYTSMREAVSRARESERVKNNFLMAASHELRTPLTAVQGYLELLGDYGDTLDEAARARFLQNARRGCDELVLLLGNVLDVTHLDVAKIHFKPAPVYLAQSARLILEILEPIIARENRVVEMQIEQDVRVWIDELRLRQVLLNLLGNALKYTATGTRVDLYTQCPDEHDIQEHFPAEEQSDSLLAGGIVLLVVRDWGPGIPQAEQGQLFTRFTRLDSARNSSQPGAGLGLYLCKQLLEAMGGRIWMESSGVPGEGAAFFVALPGYRA
jgi:signal transduction histidine kinase